MVVETESVTIILLLRRGFVVRRLILFTDSLGLDESLFQLLILSLKVIDGTFRPFLRSRCRRRSPFGCLGLVDRLAVDLALSFGCDLGLIPGSLLSLLFLRGRSVVGYLHRVRIQCFFPLFY